jgi:hypothetical protein
MHFEIVLQCQSSSHFSSPGLGRRQYVAHSHVVNVALKIDFAKALRIMSRFLTAKKDVSSDRTDIGYIFRDARNMVSHSVSPSTASMVTML